MEVEKDGETAHSGPAEKRGSKEINVTEVKGSDI